MKKIFLSLLIIFIAATVIHLSCKKLDLPNQPPIAIAGPDQIITLPIDSVSLDGSRSSDPDGVISSFLWTKISGPSSFLIVNTESAKTAIKNLVNGVYLIELKVTDPEGLFEKDTLMITVNSIASTNRFPIANAGPDQIVTPQTDIAFLDGSKSIDPDGTISTFLWTKIYGPSSFLFVHPDSVKATIKNLVKGVYLIELTVTDNEGLSASDIIMITVPFNYPPAANAGKDMMTAINFAIVLDGSASFDPDGDIIRYTWLKTSGPSNFRLEKNDNARVRAIFFAEGIYQFELSVNDSRGVFSIDTIQVTVIPDALPSNEIIYNNLEWMFWHDQGAPSGDFDEIYLGLSDSNNLLPDAPDANFRVYVKRDSTSNWEQASATIFNGSCVAPFWYHLSPISLLVELCFLDKTLIGKKGSIKVTF